MTYATDIDGVLIASPIVAVNRATEVSIAKRRVRSQHHGEATWLDVREFGVRVLLAVRSNRGWERVA